MNKDEQIEQYNYYLPESKIAKYPLSQRDSSKLLVWTPQKIVDTMFSHASAYIPENALLVFNNTRVIHARMLFKKSTGAQIEIFCLEPYIPHDYQQVFAETQSCTWHCFVGNAKKWKHEPLQLNLTVRNCNVVITATLLETLHNSYRVHFSWNADVSFGEILETIGEIPIPPYLSRKSENIDDIRYQTVYAEHEGSVAAPTAGLHFTPQVLDDFSSKNIHKMFVTLHVGAGTFKPIQLSNYKGHTMHREFFTVPRSCIESLKNQKFCVAVGTTSVRTLESLYWIGVILHTKRSWNGELAQWEAYSLPQTISLEDACDALLRYMDPHSLSYFYAYTHIMIVPGYTFRVVNAMFTNFHQPKSTLLLLVSAFVGSAWKKIYEHALESDYRFLSYGDSTLLFPHNYAHK